EAFAAELRKTGTFALHLVIDSPLAMRAEIVGIALSHQARLARYLPLAPPPKESARESTRPAMSLLDAPAEEDAQQGLDLTQALAILKPLLEDANVQKITHDAKFATIVFERHGIALRGATTDTILVSYVLDATRSSHRLEDLALEELTYRM